jgi:hypothetical protein
MADRHHLPPKLHSITCNKKVNLCSHHHESLKSQSMENLQDLRFSQQRFWRFKSSGMLCSVEVMVPEVLKDHNAFIFKVKQPMKKYVFLTLKTNALRSFRISVTVALTLCNIPEDSNLQRKLSEVQQWHLLHKLNRGLLLIYISFYSKELLHELTAKCGATIIFKKLMMRNVH